MTTNMALTARPFLLRLAVAGALVFAGAVVLRAGGPKCVAGSSYFDATMTGQPLIWPAGSVNYYTDRGDLSPILANDAANSFVASAFSVWTSVPTAALAASSGGQLSEDVNGTNVVVNGDGTISMPADVQPTATGTPVGVIYDYDGAVTDALLGTGAGNASQCFFNAAFGGSDNYGSLATYQHALIVLNGQCLQNSSQLTDVEYRLVRVIGNVLGLGWSQVNVNVQTGSPHPTPDDYAGFPVMHYTDSWNCAPITLCYPNPYQLSADDSAAISRLYPVTAGNQSSFPGKQNFSANTARIYGSVYFTDTHGNPTQPMQGVNVVARWIDPNSGLPSRRYASSSVSGFLFRGNAGNLITGLNDPLGDPFSEWGSNDQGLEGFFDLSSLPLPNSGSGQYQLSIEAVDPFWSAGVGPYSPGPVSPSGTFTPITVSVSAGSNVEQDILMRGTTQPLPQAPSSWTSPASLPASGDWNGSLSGYGDTPFFQLFAQANRTLSVAVTALNDAGAPNTVKAQPVIGMWAASDPPGSFPGAYTPGPFNQAPVGMTRLDGAVSTSSNFLIGISDLRGDGRPDYTYHAHVLYADSITPARIPVSGGAITVHGTGFSSGLAVTVGNTVATQLGVSAGQITLAAPAEPDGVQNITITDPSSGSQTSMTSVLTYGASASDQLKLVYGSNPSTPVGMQAANPVTVQALATDGTPVGATIVWSSSNGASLSACGGATSCSAITDQNGEAATWVTPAAIGESTITATLAPSLFGSSKSVMTTLSASESSSDIGVLDPYVWISQAESVVLPITARALASGIPRSGAQINFTVVSGTGSLSAPSSLTDANGNATVNVTIPAIAALVQVSACAAPANAPCAMWYANPVPLARQVLQQVSGAGQISTSGTFQPIVVRVIDSAYPQNAVTGASVLFQTTVYRAGGESSGDGTGNNSMPVVLSVSQTYATTDVNGLANLVPSSGGFSPPLDVDVSIMAGSGAVLDDLLQLVGSF